MRNMQRMFEPSRVEGAKRNQRQLIDVRQEQEAGHARADESKLLRPA